MCSTDLSAARPGTGPGPQPRVVVFQLNISEFEDDLCGNISRLIFCAYLWVYICKTRHRARPTVPCGCVPIKQLVDLKTISVVT